MTDISKLSYIAIPDYIYIPSGSNHKICGEFKHNLICGEKTCLENILDSAINLESKVISTVRESQYFREKYSLNKDVQILEARENLVDSAIYALIEGYVNHFYEPKFTRNWANIRKIKLFAEKNESIKDLTMLCVGSDSPFISLKDLKLFVANYNSLKEKPDIYVGLTSMEKLGKMCHDLNLDFKKIDSTINNYCITDKGLFRISNMYIMKPFKMLDAGIAGSLQKIYDNRKLSQGVTQYLGILEGLASIVGRIIIHPFATSRFARDIYVASRHFRGNYLGRAIELDKAFKNTSKVIGLDVKADITCNIGPLLDIDDEASYLFYKQNYDKIKVYLEN